MPVQRQVKTHIFKMMLLLLLKTQILLLELIYTDVNRRKEKQQGEKNKLFIPFVKFLFCFKEHLTEIPCVL